jgi:4-hydroxybenzoate polyprenyltransferase
LLNDLLDIDNDRKHKVKKQRLIAQGVIGIPESLSISVILVASGLLLSFYTGILPLLLLYIAITIAYSTYLKKIAIVDIVTLAGLYCLRIIAGGGATGDAVSFWITAFGGFIFLSLACVKRHSELINLLNANQNIHNNENNPKHALGRGYNLKDIDLTRSIGVATGCITPLVLALYLESIAAEQFYKHPEYLWGCCAVIFTWIMTIWRDTGQNHLHEEDPITYSLTNKKSLVLLSLFILILILATYIP